MRNKPGTLVQHRYPRKYARYPREKTQVPSTRYCATMKWPSESSLILDVPNAPMFFFQIRHFMYKPLQTEWEPLFAPSRRPRPSPFWRGILQVASYALPLCRGSPLCQLCRLAAKNSPAGLVAYSVLLPTTAITISQHGGRRSRYKIIFAVLAIIKYPFLILGVCIIGIACVNLLNTVIWITCREFCCYTMGRKRRVDGNLQFSRNQNHGNCTYDMMVIGMGWW